MENIKVKLCDMENRIKSSEIHLHYLPRDEEIKERHYPKRKGKNVS